MSFRTFVLIYGWRLLNSEVINIEISKIADNDKSQKVTILSIMLQSNIVVDEDIERRAIEVENLSFKFFDALHGSVIRNLRPISLFPEFYLLNKSK